GRLHAEPRRTVSDPARRREGGTVRRPSHDGISQAARRSLASVPGCPHFVRRGLTPRWSQRRLPLELWLSATITSDFTGKLRNAKHRSPTSGQSATAGPLSSSNTSTRSRSHAARERSKGFMHVPPKA